MLLLIPAESIMLGFIRSWRSKEERSLLSVSKEYLPGEGSRGPGGAEEQDGLVAIPTVSPGMAGVCAHLPVL